jgi:rod shape-determining protein MreD
VGYFPPDVAGPSASGCVDVQPSTHGRHPRVTAAQMSHLLAAVGAVAAALVELSLGPYLWVGDAHPHPVLVFGVIWTIAVGVESGLTWAFVGGIALDTLASRPLGVSAFALLVSLGAASVIGRSFVRIRPLAPIIAVPILSLVNSMILFALFAAIRPPVNSADPIVAVMPGAVYDAVLGVLFGPLAVSILDRRNLEERVDW